MEKSSFVLGLLNFLALFNGFLGGPCEIERKFVKVDDTDSLPSISALKITTVTKSFYCSIECAAVSNCKSYMFKTALDADNCVLSANPDGGKSTVSPENVLFVQQADSVKGCESNPCQNGATCHDSCNEPYYFCECSDAEGENCEWSMACSYANWEISFDSAGLSTCPYSTQFLSGLRRGAINHGLDAMESGYCCPVPLKYSQHSFECHTADWWNTFAFDGWSYCDSGYFLWGLWRTDGSQDLGYIEEAKCCRPIESAGYGECYYELDAVEIPFDSYNALAKCSRPHHYVIGIRTSQGTQLGSIEEFHCCTMA